MKFDQWFSQFVDKDGNPSPEYEDHEMYMKLAWHASSIYATQPVSGDRANVGASLLLSSHAKKCRCEHCGG